MENKKITTEGGYVVEIKAFITGRQVQELNAKIDESLPESKRNIEMSNKSIELLVVSVNGKTDDILNTVLDLPFPDYTKILELVGELINPKKNEPTTKTI